MAASIAAPSGSKARLFEHRDVRVRAGPLGARSAVEWSQPDVGETVMPGANGFGYFCRNKSSPLAWEASGKRHGCRTSACVEASIPSTLPSAVHLTSLSHLRERRVSPA